MGVTVSNMSIVPSAGRSGMTLKSAKLEKNEYTEADS